jgi:uncharacterized tellurite resistance protein B-like protein
MFRFLFGDRDPERPATASDALRALVARSVPEADPATAAQIASVAGLCASVAHADRSYTEAERSTVRSTLGRMAGLGAGAVAAIDALLAERLAELAHESLQTYTRVLYEGLTREARLEVLAVLLELASADERLDMAETQLLRRIARGLGISDDEYVVLQEPYKQRLSVLGR